MMLVEQKGVLAAKSFDAAWIFRPELAELSRLSSLAAEGLPDSVVVAAFTRLRVLISASTEAVLHIH